MQLNITEIRYSLNGISEGQLQNLFDLLDNEDNQIIFKRISDSRYALSSDDIILLGNFSISFITSVSQFLFPPLMFKIEGDFISRDIFDIFGAKKWESENTTIFVGNTIIPANNLKNVIGYTMGDQFLKLLTTTPAGSALKSLLITKPKGLFEVGEGFVKIIFPFHRIDFILDWVKQVIMGVVTFDWLSGVTDELDKKLIGCNGNLPPNLDTEIIKWVNSLDTFSVIELERSFKRALKVVI